MLDSFWKLKYNDSYANNQILIVYYLKAWNLKNFFFHVNIQQGLICVGMKQCQNQWSY